MQLLLDERECASIVGVGEGDLVERLRRESFCESLDILAVVADYDDVRDLMASEYGEVLYQTN